MNNLNNEVTIFLDNLNHPRRSEIEILRKIILNSNKNIFENIKWNAPNYVFENEDRITMRILPLKHCQLIFHCGAKVKAQPNEKLISYPLSFIIWKENNRAVASFKNQDEIMKNEIDLNKFVKDWFNAKY